MDFSALLLITATVALVAMTLRARQLRIATRDVAVLGGLGGLCALGSLATALT